MVLGLYLDNNGLPHFQDYRIKFNQEYKLCFTLLSKTATHRGKSINRETLYLETLILAIFFLC